MSKRLIFLVFVCFAIIVAGCSKDKGESTGKSKLLEAKIENASYVLSERDQGNASEGESSVLAIEVKVKNLTDSTLNIFPTQNFKLYDGDEEIDANDKVTYDLGKESGNLGAKKSKNINVAFTVEKDKKYELAIRTTSKKGEDDETKLKLDTSNYSESLQTLEDPAKALTAYIETIYLDKDNADYGKLVLADKEQLQDEANKAFDDSLKDIFRDGVPENKQDKFYQEFKSVLGEKAELQTEVLSNLDGKAVVQVKSTALPLGDMMQMASDYRKEYMDKKKDFDREKADKYALSKFDNMINKLEPKSARDFEIKMQQKDGKWTVDTSDYGEYLVKYFAAGQVF